MQTENRFFDDLARMASGAMGTMSSLKTEFETQVRQQIDTLLARMKLVTREEFDAMQAMLVKTRAEQESLAARLAALEIKIADDIPPE
jgi:BMFP domain-containing protein YqiC